MPLVPIFDPRRCTRTQGGASPALDFRETCHTSRFSLLAARQETEQACNISYDRLSSQLVDSIYSLSVCRHAQHARAHGVPWSIHELRSTAPLSAEIK